MIDRTIVPVCHMPHDIPPPTVVVKAVRSIFGPFIENSLDVVNVLNYFSL